MGEGLGPGEPDTDGEGEGAADGEADAPGDGEVDWTVMIGLWQGGGSTNGKLLITPGELSASGGQPLLPSGHTPPSASPCG